MNSFNLSSSFRYTRSILKVFDVFRTNIAEKKFSGDLGKV